MTQTSFKKMVSAGTIKRADLHKIRYEDLHVEAGFNWRESCADLDADNEAFTAYIVAGGTYPPLEVRTRPEGGVYIVDGHRRHHCIGQAIKQGAPMQDKDGDVWISVIQFTGNDAERAARVFTSQEGRKLTVLEAAKGYKRLAAFGLDAVEIAKLVNKTRQHVDQMLILANANTDVHKLVASGAVSGTLAVDMVRKHGEMAGGFIAAAAEKSTRGKATASTAKAWAPSKKIALSLYENVEAFTASLPNDARMKLASIENAVREGQLPDGQMVSVPAAALLVLLATQEEISSAKKDHEETKSQQGAQGELQ